MPLISQKRISNYLRGFSNTPRIQNLLRRAIGSALERDHRYLGKVSTLKSLRLALEKPPGTNLRKAFKSSSAPWYVFRPNQELTENIKLFAGWLEHETSSLETGKGINNAINKKIAMIKSIEDALELTKAPLLTPDEIETALNEKRKPQEEIHGHIRTICALPDNHNLVQILTSTGMKNAGEKAGNCLGSKVFPRHSIPHRARVKHQDRWLYFSIRNVNNESVVTIGVDREHGTIEWEGNNQTSVDDDHYDLAIVGAKEIIRRYPDILKNLPYGSQRRVSYRELGFYDLDR